MFKNLKNAILGDEGKKIINIPINDIAPNPAQARKHYDNLSLAALARSIEEYGIIQPVTVRIAEEGYELISGERRLRAAVMAGLSEVPALVVDADRQKSAIFSLLENLQREDLSFLEVAQSYKDLIREQGLTQEELAKRVGKSRSSVANKLRLLKLSPKARRMIKDYSISERHARCILSVPDEYMQLEVIKQIYQNNLNVKQTEKVIEDCLISNQKPVAEKKMNRDSVTFIGTIRRAVETMRKSGIDASIQKMDRDWGTEYVIEIKQESSAAIK